MWSRPDPPASGDTTDTTPTAPPKPHLTTGKKIVFAVLTVVLALIVAEGLCRLAGLGKRVQIAGNISDWHNTPEGRTFWVPRGPGYNTNGMRDREHPERKPPGTFRIVCLGDSVTVGHTLKRSQSYPTIFEHYLRQLGLTADVMNVAVSGWSTQQEAAAYRHIARRYQPDHVFLGFCLNDVAEMRNNLTRPPSASARFMVRHSAMVRWLVDAEGRQISDVRQLFTEPDSQAVRDGWRRVFEELAVLKDWTRADGCRLSVVIFPFRFQLVDDSTEPLAQQTLFQFCRRNAIPCLDLLPALKTMGADAFIDQSHLSFEGAGLVAEELVRWGRTGCTMCGYDLADVDADVCPRCGEPIKK